MKTLIPDAWQLPQIFYDRMGGRAGRQRAMFHEQHLLLILHDVPKTASADRVGVLFWRNPKGEWRTTLPGAGLAALRALLDAYGAQIDALEHDLDTVDDVETYHEILQWSFPLKRATEHLHDALQTAREALPKDKDLIYLRDHAYDLARAAEILDEEANNGLEYETARIGREQARSAEQLAKSGQRLNVLATLFLPLTAIASAFGMNLPHGLESIKTPLLFWGVLGTGLVIGYALRNQLDRTASPPSPNKSPTSAA